MDQRYNHKTWHPESEEGESMEYTWTYIQREGLYGYALRDSTGIKTSHWQMAQYKTEKILNSKEYNYSRKEAPHRMK